MDDDATIGNNTNELCLTSGPNTAIDSDANGHLDLNLHTNTIDGYCLENQGIPL